MTTTAQQGVKQQSTDAGGGFARLRRRIGRVVGSQRVRPIWITALLLAGIFSGFRLGLLVASWASIRTVPGADLLHCLLLGMQYDLKPLGYMLLPMALLLGLAPPSWFRRRTLRWTVTCYAAGLVLLAVLMEIIGACFFSYFGFRLDGMLVQYIEHYHEIFGYIFEQYPAELLMILLALGYVGACWLLRKLFWKGSIPLHGRRVRLAHAVVLVGLGLIACRGSLGRTPLRSAGANLYFTENNLVVELSRNNFTTVASAIWSSMIEPWEESKLFGFPSPQIAVDRARQMLAQPGDTFYDNPYNPLWRQTDTGRAPRDCNVVMIVMESMAGSSVGALGNAPTHTPFFDALCREGTFFERMYAVGPRTNRGLTGLLCSHPDFMGPSLLKRDEGIGNIRTLPGVFAERGYRTMFFYGADPEFDNMREFFSHAGIAELYTDESMTGTRGAFSDGFHDEAVFDKAMDVLEQVGPDERFFSVILTLSNHDPWVVPERPCGMLPVDEDSDTARQQRMANAYRYADWSLHRFFERIRQSQPEWLSNTIFVLVADHGQQAEQDKRRSIDAPAFRVPCLIYAPFMPELAPPQRIATVCSQTDLAPTLMGLLGGTYEHSFLGRDITRVQDEGFAMLRKTEPLGFIRGDELLVLPPRSGPRLYHLDAYEMREVTDHQTRSAVSGELMDDLLAYYGAARYLFSHRALQRPPGLDAIQADEDQDRPLHSARTASGPMSGSSLP